MGDDLRCNNIQKHGEREILQNYLLDEGKGVREETICFNFLIEYFSSRFISGRLNCHGKSRNGNKKFEATNLCTTFIGKKFLQIRSKLVKFFITVCFFVDLKSFFSHLANLKHCFILEIPLTKNFSLMSSTVIRVVNTMLLIMVKPIGILSLELQDMWVFLI